MEFGEFNPSFPNIAGVWRGRRIKMLSTRQMRCDTILFFGVTEKCSELTCSVNIISAAIVVNIRKKRRAMKRPKGARKASVVQLDTVSSWTASADMQIALNKPWLCARSFVNAILPWMVLRSLHEKIVWFDWTQNEGSSAMTGCKRIALLRIQGTQENIIQRWTATRSFIKIIQFVI